MKFDESSLTEYLVKNLKPLTEADPAFLADYVVALLKKNKPVQELQKLCVDNLVEFLGHGTKSFVAELFKTFEDATIMTSDGTTDDITRPELLPIAADHVRQSSSPRDENPSASRQFSDSEEKEVSDDEDDDRNHKHRRRDNRPQPLEEDGNGQFSRLPFRKKNRPNENGQQFVEREFRQSELLKEYSPFSERDSSSIFDKRRSAPFPHNPGEFGQKTRMGRGLRPNNSSRFDLSTNLLRPPVGGRGRGASSWNQHDTRFNPLDPLGFASQMPSLLGAGFSSTASGQSTSWGSYGFIPGMSNGCLDPLHPLNLQGALHPPINPVNVGMPRQRCRDFEERGFCLRGDMCPMEHGVNRIVVEDVQSLSQFNLPVSLPTSGILSVQPTVGPLLPATSSNPLSNSKSAPNKASKSGLGADGAIPVPIPGAEADVYDPDQPLWNNDRPETSSSCLRLPSPNIEDVGTLWEAGPTDQNNFSLSAGMGNEQINLSLGGHPLEATAAWGRARPSNFTGMRRTASIISVSHGNGMKKESEPVSSSLSTDGNASKIAKFTDTDGGRKPGKNSQKAQRTLFVNGIPQNNNRREALISHFHKFGEIIDIYIPMNSEKAFVQFSRREEAEAALKSPDAVMGNRFIKLWWANRDNIPDGATKGQTAPIAIQSAPTSGQPQGLVRDRDESRDSTVPQKVPAVGAQKSIPQVQGKAENLESLKEELRKKQESLKQKRDEFKRQLEKLQKQALSTNKIEPVAEQPVKKSKTEDTADAMKASTPRPVNNNIVGGHQELEKAQERGNSRETVLSPSSKFSTTAVLPSPRSSKLTSHSLGFYANRFKIDNRPTSFRIISPLPDNLASVEALKEHFSSFGDLAGIELDASDLDPSSSSSWASSNRSALITFSTRRSAERAFSSGSTYQGHSLQFAWFTPNASSKSVPNTGEISASKVPKDSSSSLDLGETLNSNPTNKGGGGEGAEKGESPVLVSLSTPLSTAECEEGSPRPDALLDEGLAAAGSAE